MSILSHHLGFPRIGKKRELKFALEAYWRAEISAADLENVGKDIRKQNYHAQAGLDYLTSGDFAFYDPVLTLSFALGHLPPRLKDAANSTESDLDQMFRLARGRSRPGQPESFAGEMTKWFNTNYHYIVPEFYQDSTFTPQSQEYINAFQEARHYQPQVKPVLIGPLTYLFLGKAKDQQDKLKHLPALLAAYRVLLQDLRQAGAEWIQIDEPILAMALNPSWQHAFQVAYQSFDAIAVKLLLTVYFGRVEGNIDFIKALPVAGLHLDALAEGENLENLLAQQPAERILSLGVVSGRNIWATDLNKTLNRLIPLAEKYGDRLWLAPNCSLAHVPVSRTLEKNLGEKQNWFCFAEEKIQEIQILQQGLSKGRESIAEALVSNQAALAARQQAVSVYREADFAVPESLTKRQADFATRYREQQKHLQLPDFPTTTIGSFPQTTAIRQTRQALRQGKISVAEYEEAMRTEIARVIVEQETLGLDVLVHGEAERNDMVEYFAEHLEGFLLTQHGWVQSYGSRCVKPPILFGEVKRPQPITLPWIQYAQSLSKKPVKGMLTGPVTMLNWSFVRDDQATAVTAYQLALSIRQEILDLEAAGIRIIQLDEPALREGLPLRQSDWENYLTWAVRAFQIAGNGLGNQSQLHTHMCYSEFSDILPAIAALDADVITIETARSDMELLDSFAAFHYPNAIGPGIYDIHSPNVPKTENMLNLMQKALQHLPKERLWINPDCGLKTRQWPEVKAALANMVSVAKTLREKTKA
jgi:5-methyltetrahydropteroyltriglutamate--homocysteine methyltransferase